ncbi:3-hydroxyisobutyrate dehydrogenase-like protein [Octadecabacter antarcticus 307]|uniref:3-hydroxyisobutyrate dehydrogenase-like protein n=1 Tax=Octadecabacter antarcticus 307 TaxID=391626 RepID=M9R0S1_9RHOB|nr:NAD(P)-dependent oxidoreductase [Octadecabacter antarcticus]AGI65847.1 3-hydroxyisobutyrate dehydrogenase-like protein [Octadecabacter antarcticus 307]
MAQDMTIGFIGVGFMGHGMASNLIKGGYSMWIRGNRNREPIESLIAKGAQEAATPSEMAQHCDVIHLCLSNSPQVEAVIRGVDGILAGARDGLIVIDTTTADPTSTAFLAAELAAKGATLVDAPLGRTPKEAEAGTLDAMVGCDAATFAKIKPVLDCWAGNITHVGDTGSGHKMKLLMNFISMGYAALYAEATVLGASVGLPPAKVRDVIGSSRLSNGFFDTFMTYAVDRDREIHKFTIENASKDLRYVNAMAAEVGMVNIMAGAVKHYFTHVEALGQGGDYVPMLIDHVARMNGMDMEVEAAKGRD